MLLASVHQIEPAAIVLGAIVGLLVGLTGMGGASLMTPLLVLVLGVKPVLAVGTDLIYSSVTKACGSVVHLRQGTPDVRIAIRMAWGSVPGALLGVFALGLLAKHLNTDALNGLVLHLLGVMLVLVSITMFLRVLLSGRLPLPSLGSHRWVGVFLPIVGFFVGFLVGLTSVGSGSLLIVALALCTQLPAVRLVGTDLVHAVILTAVAGLAHLAVGNVNISLTMSLLIGSIPGVLVGSRLCSYLPDRSVRLALAGTLLVSGLRLI
jgi:uncharacterized membrane protein YfcA